VKKSSRGARLRVRIVAVRRQRLRPLTEAEAYARCHGRRESDVRIVKIEPRRPRYQLEVSGEDLRRKFEEKLDHRAVESEEPVGGTA
jgi:hypothetical protein